MATSTEKAIDHVPGKSCSNEDSNVQPKLADVKFPETPEDQKEQPKSLKKKNSDRQSRRDREAQGAGDAARQSTSSFRLPQALQDPPSFPPFMQVGLSEC